MTLLFVAQEVLLTPRKNRHHRLGGSKNDYRRTVNLNKTCFNYVLVVNRKRSANGDVISSATPSLDHDTGNAVTCAMQ